jgi:hypothetical protein
MSRETAGASLYMDIGFPKYSERLRASDANMLLIEAGDGCGWKGGRQNS